MSGFPTSIDSFPTILPSDKQDTAGKELDAVLNSFSSAIVAAETRIGINGSADTNSLDHKVASVFASLTATQAAIGYHPASGVMAVTNSLDITQTGLDSVSDW